MLKTPAITPSQRTPEKPFWLRRSADKLLISAIVVFIVGSGVLLAAAMVYLREETLRGSEKRTHALGLLVAEQVSSTLETIDQSLHLVENEIVMAAVRNATSAPGAMRSLLQSHIQSAPFLQGLWILDDSGKVLVQSGDVPFAGESFALPVTSASEPMFLVGKPVRTGPGQWLVHFARPMRSSTGAVQRVLVTAISTRHFDAVWANVDLGNDGSISLLGRDGIMYSRSPNIDRSVGKNFSERPVFKTMLPLAPSGGYRDKSAVDGIERWFEYQTLPRHADFVVIVGQSTGDALVSWHQWVNLVSLMWVFGTLATAGMGWLIMRSMKNRQDAENAVIDSERRYSALFNGAMDGMLLTHTDGTVQFANPAACDMLGHTEDSIRRLGRAGLLDPSDQRLPQALAIRAQTGGFRGELTFLRQNGSTFEAEVSSSVHYAVDGNARSSIIIRDATEKNRIQAKLQENARRMQELSRSVIETQENERRRIAMELHDELGQSLTAIKINLQSGANFKNQSPQALNVENIRIVEDALLQVRQLAMALRPSILDNLGLTAALNWLGKQTAKRGNLKFSMHAQPWRNRLAPELETTYFRVAQEALTNVLRHASAQVITITLENTETDVLMRIEDDGVGMDLDLMAKNSLDGHSLGTLGMGDRASLIGGQLTIDSQPGAGCRVSLQCHLNFSSGTP